MSYTFELDTEKLKPIAHHLEAITNLTTGAYAIICVSPEEAARLRFQLYNWLHHIGRKQDFKISWSFNQLTIKRKGIQQTSGELRDETLGPKLDKIFQDLILTENKDTAVEHIMQLYKAEEITATELAILLRQYERTF